MASQPPQESTGGRPRGAAPFQPPTGSAGGWPQTPAVLMVQPDPRVARFLHARRYIILVDWSLERVEGQEGKVRVAGIIQTPQMRNGAASSERNRKVATRVFRSSPIVERLDQVTIESEDGYLIKIRSLLNKPKTLENGFSEEVCACFEFGFPYLWKRVVNPKMVPDNERAQSPSETTASEPSHSIEYYMEKFLSDDFSSVGYTGSLDGLCTQSLSNLPDNAGNITASWGLYGLRMDVPEKALAPPGEACNNSQEPGIPNSEKNSVNLETTDALELPTETTTPKFEAIRGSEDSIGRTLRSGKVLKIPSGTPMKRGHKEKKFQQEASSKQMVNQGASSTVDLTSHENDFSAAEIVIEEKLESHASCSKGRGRPAKVKRKSKRKQESAGLFWNWL